MLILLSDAYESDGFEEKLQKFIGACKAVLCRAIGTTVEVVS
jgi:hypothetical protein